MNKLRSSIMQSRGLVHSSLRKLLHQLISDVPVTYIPYSFPHFNSTPMNQFMSWMLHLDETLSCTSLKSDT